MKTHKEVMNELPAEERALVMARTRELLAEEVALQHLREARQLTQKTMAELLGVGQDSVSRLERRSDLLISTLQKYIKAMGGTLKFVVQFPEGTTTLSGLGEEPIERAPKRKTAPKRAQHAPRSRRAHLDLV